MSITVCEADDKFLFAFSLSTVNFLRALRFDLTLVFLFCFWNTFIHYSTILLSKSSPPKCVSPPVALTSNIPSMIVNSVTSNVPPPKS